MDERLNKENSNSVCYTGNEVSLTYMLNQEMHSVVMNVLTISPFHCPRDQISETACILEGIDLPFSLVSHTRACTHTHTHTHTHTYTHTHVNHSDFEMNVYVCQMKKCIQWLQNLLNRVKEDKCH